MSALEMSPKVQVSYKSALFMMNRIRFAMAEAPTDGPKFTGTIEADEMYVGGRPRHRSGKKGPNLLYPKVPVFAVVERGGKVKAQVMPTVTADNVRETLLAAAEPSCKPCHR